MSKHQVSRQKLTELELEVMGAVWDLGETTIPDVHAKLQEKKKYAYTTVATMMNILEKKKYLKVMKQDRAHKYTALIVKDAYENTAIGHLVERLFDGEPSRLVMKLLDASGIQADELKEIRKTLEKRLKDV